MRRLGWALCAGLAATIACADDMAGMKMGVSAADKALMESMRKMMIAMHVHPTGDADKDFVDMMLPHHQGAVDMAKVEMEYGKDAGLRDLANGIIGAQEKEIATMKAWRAAHPK